MNKIRLLVADDELLVRQGLCRLLQMEPDFEVVGQAANGVEAVAAVSSLQPDIVLMDIQMPLMNGVEATLALRAENSAARVLVLTTFDDDALVMQALQSGAHGYLLKDSGSKQLAAAIRSAAKGQVTLSAAIGQKVLQNVTDPEAKDIGSLPVTERQRQVLDLLGRGHTNAEIAALLGIGEKTVRDHICHILQILNLRDRTQAALWAQQNNTGL